MDSEAPRGVLGAVTGRGTEVCGSLEASCATLRSERRTLLIDESRIAISNRYRQSRRQKARIAGLYIAQLRRHVQSEGEMNMSARSGILGWIAIGCVALAFETVTPRTAYAGDCGAGTRCYATGANCSKGCVSLGDAKERAGCYSNCTVRQSPCSDQCPCNGCSGSARP
jgi:hypothetical protein